MKKYRLALGILIMLMLTVMVAPVTVYGGEILIRVGLTRSFENRDSVIITNTSIFVGYGSDIGFIPVAEHHASGGFTARMDGGQVVLSSGGQILHRFTAGNPAQLIASGSEFVIIGGYSFRGAMEFHPSGGGRITAINVLTLDDYILGVIPSEMGPNFHIEALKAQAVASRTYAAHAIGRGRHRARGFDICDTTCCQVYRGAGSENDIATEAVRATHGLLMLYNGNPILAQYFSSSGGATSNSEDVWTEALPYLRSVREIYEHGGARSWTRNFTWAQLTSAANNAGLNAGTVNGISITQLSSTGRVSQLTLHGTNGQRTVDGERAVRTFFSNIGGALPNNNFRIAGGSLTSDFVYVSCGWHYIDAPLNEFYILDRNGAITSAYDAYVFDGQHFVRIDFISTVASGGSGISIEGSGWGHGVGMSQHGAEGMARLGFTYREILHHYYTGVEIR